MPRSPHRALHWGLGVSLVLLLAVTRLMAAVYLPPSASAWSITLIQPLFLLPVGGMWLALVLVLSAAGLKWRRRQLSAGTRRLLRVLPWLLSVPYIIYVAWIAFLSFVLGPIFFDGILALFRCGPDPAPACAVVWPIVVWLLRLLPGGVLLVLLVVTSRRAWVGGVALFVGTALYLQSPLGRIQPVWMNVLFVGPAVGAGLLFLVRWWLRADLAAGQAGAAPDATLDAPASNTV